MFREPKKGVSEIARRLVDEVSASPPEPGMDISPIWRFGYLTGFRIRAYNPIKPGDGEGRQLPLKSGD